MPMDEDLILLGMNIRKDPLTYKNEYLTQLKTFESLMNLPTVPIKQIKPMIFFIVKYSHVEPSKAIGTLVNSLDLIQDYRTKRVILNGLIIIRQKKLIESKELLRLVIIHGNDLRYFLSSVQEFLDVNCYSVLKDWYSKGTERQKSFCYFLLLVLFSKIHDVQERKRMEREMVELDYENSVESSQLSNEDTDNSHSSEYTQSSIQNENILEQSDDNEMSEEIEKKINFARDEVRFSNLNNSVDLDELEQILCQAFFVPGRLSKICCLYFLNRTEVKFDISKIKKGFEYGKMIYKSLNEIMDREIKIMKLKIFTLFKNSFNIKKSILNIVVKMINLENEDLKDLLDCLVRSIDRSETEEFIKMISEEFCYEGQQEDIIVLGINVLRELYSKFLFSKEKNIEEEEFSSFLEDLKTSIFKSVESFQRNRSKPIHYAYKMLVKVLINNERVEAPVNQIKRRSTKEEMNILRTKGREEIKRLRAEAKREEDHHKYKNKTKGRKQKTMAKYMMKPTKKRGLKKKQKCK